MMRNPLPATEISRGAISDFLFDFPSAYGPEKKYTQGDITSTLNQITPDYIFTVNTHDDCDIHFHRYHHHIVLLFADEWNQVSFIQHISKYYNDSRSQGLEIIAGPQNSIILRDGGDGMLFWRLQDLIAKITNQHEVER